MFLLINDSISFCMVDSSSEGKEDDCKDDWENHWKCQWDWGSIWAVSNRDAEIILLKKKYLQSYKKKLIFL